MKGYFYGRKRRSGVDTESYTRRFPVSAGKAEHSMLQMLARITASSLTALTDNSGGAAGNGTIEAVGNVTNAVLGSTDCAQKAASEAALLTATDALSEIVGQCANIHAKVPALDGTLVNSIGGTAPDLTIGALTVGGTGVGASLASAAGVKAVVTALKNGISQATYHVNKLVVACGAETTTNGPIVDLSGGVLSTSLTFAAISSGTGTATSGADITDANAAVKQSDFNAIMVLLANAIKELATKLNACRNATGGTMEVVAA